MSPARRSPPLNSRTRSKLPFDRCPGSGVNDRHPTLCSMGIKKLTVPAYKDQFSVAVTVFTPTGYSYDSAATVVILNCATGVPQTYYAPFAKYTIPVSSCSEWQMAF